MDESSLPFEQTPEALRQRFTRRDPNWNRRPDYLEPREAALERIQSRAWNVERPKEGL